MPHYSHLLNKWLSFTLVSLEGLGKLFSHILADSKEINSVIPKRNQPWIFIGRTDAEVPMSTWRADSLEKTLMLGKIEGGRRRGRQRTRWLDGITDSMDMTEQVPGDGEGQESLACYSPWGCKESDIIERLKNNKYLLYSIYFLHEKSACISSNGFWICPKDFYSWLEWLPSVS